MMAWKNENKMLTTKKHIPSAIALCEYDFPRVKKSVCIPNFYAINIYCEPA